MDEIILVGAGSHAIACIDVIEQASQFKIAGLIEKEKITKKNYLGYFIIGTDENLKLLRQKYTYALLTVGQLKSPETRVKLFGLLNQHNYKLPVIISPRAYVSKHAQVDSGTIIMHEAIVNAKARIGENCIINNKALIEHGAIISDHCHVATGAIINGDVRVGEGTFIGSGVVTKHSISIGSNCIVGAGVTLKKDLKSGEKSI